MIGERIKLCWNDKWKQKARYVEKHLVLVPYTTEFSHDLLCKRSWVSAVGSWQVTSGPMAWPFETDKSTVDTFDFTEFHEKLLSH
jgi:hypothetical protein